MKLVALALVLVACGDSKDERTQTERCRDQGKVPIARQPKLGFVRACGPILARSCADAVAGATETMKGSARDRIVLACRGAYPTLAPTATEQELFAHALEDTGIIGPDAQGLALGIVSNLSPTPLRARLSDGSFEVDGVGTWKLPAEPTPDDFAPALDAMAAHGQPHDGVLVWGADGGPARQSLVRALALRHWESVYCMRDGSNCPAR